MAEPGTVIGWLLSEADREMLLNRFPPHYDNVVAHHVTLASGATSSTPLPPDVSARMVGHADNGAGVECVVIEIDGTTDRPDGSTYHITWSLADGRRARESNDVLREKGWQKLDVPIPIRLQPQRF